MIRLHISSSHFDLSDKVVAYVEQKIGGLDRYLPKNAKNGEGSVLLAADPSGKEDNNFVCEANLKVAGPDLQAREATANIYAAIDIVEAKLKAQAVRYKEKHSPRSQGRRLMSRLLRRGQL